MTIWYLNWEPHAAELCSTVEVEGQGINLWFFCQFPQMQRRPILKSFLERVVQTDMDDGGSLIRSSETLYKALNLPATGGF